MLHLSLHSFKFPTLASQRENSSISLAMSFAFLVLSACGGARNDDPESLTLQEVPALRVDGGVDPLSDSERLETLYLTQWPHDEVQEFQLRTDLRGRANLPYKLTSGHCLDALLDPIDPVEAHALQLQLRRPRPEDDANPARPRRARTAEESGQARSLRGQRVLALDRQVSTAVILPHVCPETAGDLTFDVRAAPQTTFRLRVHAWRGSPSDFGLYTRAHTDLPGFQAHGPIQTDTLPANQRRTFPFAVAKDRCVAVVAFAEEGLHDLDARLLSLQGEQLALEVATDQGSVVGPYCPFDDEIIRVEFRAYAGQGSFQWQLWDAPKTVGQRLLTAREASADGSLSSKDLEAIFEIIYPPRTRER